MKGINLYKCCGFLNHGLEFRHTKEIAVCSQVSHVGGGNIILVRDLTEKNFSVDTIWNKKAEIVEYVKNGGIYPNCKGCTDLKDWNCKIEKPSKIKLLMIQHWTKCNSNCIYCYTAANKNYYNKYKPANIYPILKEMQKKGYLDSNGLANFSGGEFTCLKEADKIVKFLSKLNYFIIVNSSGVQYSRVLAERLKKGNSCVVISVDAGTEEVHRKVKQVKTFNKVWKNLKKYASLQAKPYLVNCKYIIIPGVNDTMKELNLWLQNCKLAGIYSVVLGIDANFFEPNRDNIPEYILSLFDTVRVRAEAMGFKFSIANRALTMLTKGKYADMFWENYRYDDGVYSEMYFREQKRMN